MATTFFHSTLALPVELTCELIAFLELPNVRRFYAVATVVAAEFERKLHKERKRLLQCDRAAHSYALAQFPPPRANFMCVNRLTYSPGLEHFLRSGDQICEAFFVGHVHFRGGSCIVDYPPDFFERLVQHLLRSRSLDRMVQTISFEFPDACAAPWPNALLLPAANSAMVTVTFGGETFVQYQLRNANYAQDRHTVLEVHFEPCSDNKWKLMRQFVFYLNCAD